MRNLFAFLIKNSHWFVFILLEIICFYLIFGFNSYQKSVFFNYSNELTGRVYAISANVSSFWGLREKNEELLIQNTILQEQIKELEDYINSQATDTLSTRSYVKDSLNDKRYNYIPARVINNSVSRIENYIVINKGSRDGVVKDMGVVSMSGVVGFVRSVSSGYSIVQSVLNPKTRLNCKVKNTNAPASLEWDGIDYQYANLTFPRFEKFNIGDTIVTGGISRFFPEGYMVGTVESSESQKDDNFLTLRIKLASDFATLKNVLLITNYARTEIENLRKEVGDD